MFNKEADYMLGMEDYFDFYERIEELTLSDDKKILKSIIEEIMIYDIYDFIKKLSSLNLLIENQNKALLFDALIAGILSQPRDRYVGKNVISSGKFRKIIKKLETMGLKSMIDPAESTFIERVRYYGNYWIFPGPYYSPAYTLQGFINVLCIRNIDFDERFIFKANQLINFILEISNRAAFKLGYNLETIEHIEKKDIVIPESKFFNKLKECVCFPKQLIDDLILDEDIKALLYTDFNESDISNAINMDFQEFYNHPFLKIDDSNVLLLNCSVLVPFVIHHLVLIADEYGCKDLLIDSYNNEIWNECKADLDELGHIKIDEMVYEIELINNKNRKEQIMTVGNDKLLFVHYLCDSGINYNANSMKDNKSVVDSNTTIYDRAKYFKNRLSIKDDSQVFQIVIINSFGRDIGTEMKYEELKYSISLSPHELHCISVNERNHPEFISRYINAKSKVSIMLPPTKQSELNNIENYVSNDYSFYISDEYDLKTMVAFFGHGDSLDYVIRSNKREDRHLITSYNGEYLSDIILNDPNRKIYFEKPKGKNLPFLVVKFDKINIWLTFETIDSVEKAEIIYTTIDTLSYWLAESKDIINNMEFNADYLCLNIQLGTSATQYYNMVPENYTLLSGIKYSNYNNTINITLFPSAYQKMGEKTNQGEKELLKSVIKEISKLNKIEIDLNSVDDLFKNPLKKRVYEINSMDAPYLIPIHGQPIIISAEEEHALLDEIGEHFLSLHEYNYGRVSDDKRGKLTNDVVTYLYSLLKAEINSINDVCIYEKICYDLEVIMQNVMRSQYRYAYEITCYPEKAIEIFKMQNELNKSSVALKFFAEYIAAQPPRGEKIIGIIQYDRILAICSLIVDWAYKNDLFYYNIINTPVEFLKSGRIGMSRVETDYLTEINFDARTRWVNSISNPNILTYKPSKPFEVFQELIDDAFIDEYGYTFKKYCECINAIAQYGYTIKSEVKCENRSLLEKYITDNYNIAIEEVRLIINNISLIERDDFLKPPRPFKNIDVYPWRFNRELSFTRRPIIQRKEDLIWGNRQLYHMLSYTVDLIINGKYKARKDKLKKLVGKLSDIRGNEFNSVVYEKLKNIDGLIVREKLSKVNGKKITDDNGDVLGDIDVLYIIPEKNIIVVGEVKDYSFAKNPYEMAQEYNKIFVDGAKPCYMTRHKKRASWIEEHLEDVEKEFNIKKRKWVVKTVMFVNEEIVSNYFYHQNENIIMYSEISESTVKKLKH